MTLLAIVVLVAAALSVIALTLAVYFFSRQRDVSSANRNGDRFRQWGMWDDAIENYEKALRTDPRDALTHCNLGLALYHGKKLIDQAERELRTALDLDPTLAEAHNALGHLLFHCRHMSTDARTHLSLAVENAPGMAEPFYTMGLIESRRQNWPGAVEMFRKAVELNKDYPAAWCNLSVACVYQGRNTEAVDAAERYAEICPGALLARKNLGSIYGACGMYEEAIEQLVAARSIDANDWVVHFWLGYLYMQVSEPNKAIPSFHESLRLHRDYALAHYDLALCYESINRRDAAKKHMDHAIELHPALAAGLTEEVDGGNR
jgi:tetratricopeptide (TPR) repeat protein